MDALLSSGLAAKYIIVEWGPDGSGRQRPRAVMCADDTCRRRVGGTLDVRCLASSSTPS
jgi:hypothetical protein